MTPFTTRRTLDALAAATDLASDELRRLRHAGEDCTQVAGVYARLYALHDELAGRGAKMTPELVSLAAAADAARDASEHAWGLADAAEEG